MLVTLALESLKQRSSRLLWAIQKGRKGKRKRGREWEGEEREEENGREEGMARMVYHLISAVDRYLRTNEDHRR